MLCHMSQNIFQDFVSFLGNVLEDVKPTPFLAKLLSCKDIQVSQSATNCYRIFFMLFIMLYIVKVIFNQTIL